jgi:hypothetical protein
MLYTFVAEIRHRGLRVQRLKGIKTCRLYCPDPLPGEAVPAEAAGTWRQFGVEGIMDLKVI